MSSEKTISQNSSLRYACACGYRDEFPRVKNVNFVPTTKIGNHFTITCPECDEKRPTQILDGSLSGDPIVCIAAGTYLSPPKDSQISDNYDNIDFTDTPNPIEMASGVFIIRCENCSHHLDEADKHADSQAPETGWEYYECPNCGNRTRADIAEQTYEN